MKSLFVGNLTPNDVITAEFLVITKDVRHKKTGEPYLSLHLADRTGEIEAKMWDNVAEVVDTFGPDDFIRVKGVMQVYQKRSQFTIHRLRRMEDHEVNPADYFPCADRDVEEMFSELQNTISGLRQPHLRALLQALFRDPQITNLYKLAPAAKSIHHACRGGLLAHVLSLCSLCRLTTSHYKDIDVDLMLAGAILHDIGKIEELTYTRSFNYSAEGQLLGHIVIGLRILGDKVREVPDFPPKLRTLLEHMIISHHGELEFGSPKVPVFLEALLLHHLDNLDSKVEAMRNALKRDAIAHGEFTSWVPALERVVLRKERYLEVNAPAPPEATWVEPEPMVAAEPIATGDLKQRLYTALRKAGLKFTADAVASAEVQLEGNELLIRAPKMMMLSLKDAALPRIAAEVAGQAVRLRIEADSPTLIPSETRPTPGLSGPLETEKSTSARGNKKDGKDDSRPTLFGEKLQAVLELRK